MGIYDEGVGLYPHIPKYTGVGRASNSFSDAVISHMIEIVGSTKKAA